MCGEEDSNPVKLLSKNGERADNLEFLISQVSSHGVIPYLNEGLVLTKKNQCEKCFCNLTLQESTQERAPDYRKFSGEGGVKLNTFLLSAISTSKTSGEGGVKLNTVLPSVTSAPKSSGVGV